MNVIGSTTRTDVNHEVFFVDFISDEKFQSEIIVLTIMEWTTIIYIFLNVITGRQV